MANNFEVPPRASVKEFRLDPKRSFCASAAGIYWGCGTMRRYGFGVFQPFGILLLGFIVRDGAAMMTSSPCFQFTGVDTCAWR